MLMYIAIIAVIMAFWTTMLYIIRKGKKKHETDYYGLFSMGIIWIVFSIPFGIYYLSCIGAIFIIVGLHNKKKWKKRVFDKEQFAGAFVLGAIVAILLVIFYFLLRLSMF